MDNEKTIKILSAVVQRSDAIIIGDEVITSGEIDDALNAAIEALQERKAGEWKDRSICSCCGWYLKNRFGFAENVNFPYCPHCGAKMEVDE